MPRRMLTVFNLLSKEKLIVQITCGLDANFASKHQGFGFVYAWQMVEVKLDTFAHTEAIEIHVFRTHKDGTVSRAGRNL